MNKIKKYQMGAVLDLAPYSYYNPLAEIGMTNTVPRVTNAVQGIQRVLSKTVPHVTSVVQSIPTVLSTIAPYATAAGGTLGAGALMGGGLYLLGNAQNTAVSGAMNRSAEAQAIRERAKAEQEWQAKNNHYNSIINDGGLKLPSGSIVYKYDPTSGTAYLQKDMPNVGTSYWKQNMRTGELFDPSVINYNGIVLPVTVTGPKSGVVFNETPVPESVEEEAGTGTGTGTGAGGGDPKKGENEEKNENTPREPYRLRRKKNSTPKPEPEKNIDEFLRGWDNQGRPGKLQNPTWKQEWGRWPKTFYGAGWLARKIASPWIIPVGIGTWALGREIGWWGNKENNDSKENPDTQSTEFNINDLPDDGTW